MENLKFFFESSTIHGVSYFASTKKLQRLFWIFVVFSGFSGAGYLIQQSFQVWKDNPISTTIQTRPISEVKFPMITVCPPIGTTTNLNYDLEKTKAIEIDFEKKKDYLRFNYIKYFQGLDYQKYADTFENGFKVSNKFKDWYTGAR